MIAPILFVGAAIILLCLSIAGGRSGAAGAPLLVLGFLGLLAFVIWGP